MHHGSLLQRDLVPTYVSASTWYRAHREGELVRMHPGVSRAAAVPETESLRLEAALAAAMPGCIVAGATAARLWGAHSAAAPTIDLIAPPGRHPGRLRGVIIHRPTDTAHIEVRVVAGFPVCSAQRCVLDLAAWHPSLLRPVLDEFMVLGRLDVDDLGQLLRDQRRHGRPGVAALEREVRFRQRMHATPDDTAAVHMAPDHPAPDEMAPEMTPATR